MKKYYDVIVIGMGAHGSSVAYHSANSGMSVLCIEKFEAGHNRGSSHGVHRQFKIGNREGDFYLPLLKRADELWSDLERMSQDRIFIRSGVLVSSSGGDTHAQLVRESCAKHGIEHVQMSGTEIRQRFPAFTTSSKAEGVYQPRSGFIMSERAIAYHLMYALASGAELLTKTEARAIEESGSSTIVKTSRGAFECGQVVVATGAWMAKLLPKTNDLHLVERRATGFFIPEKPKDFMLGDCPSFALGNEALSIYGFPSFGYPGVKIGRDGHLGERGTADSLSRETNAEDMECLYEGAKELLNISRKNCIKLQSCVLTNTPDGRFIIDRLKDMQSVHIVSACSGHGFKFSSVIGEIVANRLEMNADKYDLSSFKLDRFDRNR